MSTHRSSNPILPPGWRSGFPRSLGAHRWRWTRSWPSPRRERLMADNPADSATALAESVSAADIRAAVAAGAGVIRETPVLSSRTLAERTGVTVALKAENLQRTGSFKLRGALAKLAALGDDCEAGVVTGSAGNHAQAVAYAARTRGVRCEVFMPQAASIGKLEAAPALGAEVRLVGGTVDGGLAFIHPFDDPDVVAGQGTLGLELLAQVPDISRVIVPVGGGGLLSGVAIAVKSQLPHVKVIGVQVDTCAPFPASLAAGEPIAVQSALTIADGIAVKRPGRLTLALIGRWVDEILLVPEDDVAEAMMFALERAKLVVEGAGAVGIAALLGGRVAPESPGTTVVVLSGGNVDSGLLSLGGERGANLVDVGRIREGIDLHVRETAVQLVLQTRGTAHAAQVTSAVRGAGYSEPSLVL